MRRFIIGLLVITLFLTLDAMVIWFMTPGARTPAEAIQKTMPQAISYILVKMMNRRIVFPQQINEITTLESVYSQQSQVVYQLRVNVDNSQLTLVAKQLQQNLSKTACANEQYRKMLSFGLSIVYRIRSTGGAEAQPIIFTPQTCGE